MIKKKHYNSKFIIISHYTDWDKAITHEVVDDDIFTLELCAMGESTGVYYSNIFDDFCFKSILMGLYGRDNLWRLLPFDNNHHNKH